MTKAFDKIAAGLDDAMAYIAGDTSRARVVATLDIKELRKRLHKTQNQFASSYKLPIGTVRDWEQQRRVPDAPARILLGMINADPEAVEQIIAKVHA